jgi:hypothetical protein
MGKPKSQTIGFSYYMSMLSGLCRGPIDALVEIKCGDFTAWHGEINNSDLNSINSPNLFGGEQKEGGIQGPFRVFMGEADQVLPGASGGLPDVKASIGTGLVSQFRGVVTLWFDGLVASMNPYLKDWKFRVRRAKKGWFGGTAWYPDKAVIYLGADLLTVTKNGANMTITSTSSSTQLTFTGLPNVGDTITVNGAVLTIVANGEDVLPTDISRSTGVEGLAQNVVGVINSLTASINAQAARNGGVVSIGTGGAVGTIYAMNATHIIMECCTNPEWGRGLSFDRMNEPAMIYAANKLCAEEFGICLIWYRKEDIDVFMQKVCDLVGAVLYTDRETGLITFKLIRDDYVAADLPTFGPDSGLLEIVEEDAASSDNAYNEVIGTGHDPITDQDFQVRAQNLAALQSGQGVASLDQDYIGIPTKKLLGRVVLRDLRVNASGLKRYTVKLDRRAWRLAPGMPFRINAPLKGINNIVLRAGEIDDGNMLEGTITVKAMQDAFGLPDTSYVQPVSSTWEGPVRTAVAAPEQLLIEASYRDLYLQLGAGDTEAAPATVGYIGQLALAPNTSSYQYDLATKADGEEYEDRATGAFTGNARLLHDITPLQTEIELSNLSSFDEANVGQALLMQDELVRLDALDGTTATVTRGVGDTIPQAHLAGTRLWTIDDDLVGDQRPYDVGETVNAKVLTRTSQDVMAMADAATETIVIAGRQALPYPPANVKVDGATVFALQGEHTEPVVTWASRNRITEADHLVGHLEDSVAPEDGTTYTIRVYDGNGALVRTVAGIVGLTWTYTAALQAADGPNRAVFLELESVRDGLVSYQHYRFSVVLTSGWGYSWGVNWGSPS